jgi:hypothetical protein
MILRTFRRGYASINFLHLIVLGLSVVISSLILGNPFYMWPFAYGIGFVFMLFSIGLLSSADERASENKEQD